MANAILEGTFTGTGESEAVGVTGKANVTISGGIGAVQIEKTFDQERFFPVTPGVRVSDNTPINSAFEEHETNVYYRIVCLEHSAGEIYYRIGKATR